MALALMKRPQTLLHMFASAAIPLLLACFPSLTPLLLPSAFSDRSSPRHVFRRVNLFLSYIFSMLTFLYYSADLRNLQNVSLSEQVAMRACDALAANHRR
ncbi:hypothetical protein BD769DRAFT_1513706 [Suillus cothurnatus]|nr:hypothetical protein BD769DRAFT_1513706 [Suillus cothurnatus]